MQTFARETDCNIFLYLRRVQFDCNAMVINEIWLFG